MVALNRTLNRPTDSSHFREIEAQIGNQDHWEYEKKARHTAG